MLQIAIGFTLRLANVSVMQLIFVNMLVCICLLAQSTTFTTSLLELHHALSSAPEITEHAPKGRVGAAMMHVGFEYQHHHIPAWDPPQDRPFNKSPAGHQTRGLDCSNFTTWVYNWAVGIHINSGIGAQALAQRPRAPRGGLAPHTRIERGKDCAAFVAKLCAGDLLFICDKPGGKIAHVIMWTGECAQSADGKPLVIDSTGPSHVDANGVMIPSGVHLRPFSTEVGEYWPSLSHGLRFIE
ncbi:MAG: hypothetical protein EXS14_09300 [Planctomycetes bacterium]|nr:hypothetical protein [Planctomycetota bacterium]